MIKCNKAKCSSVWVLSEFNSPEINWLLLVSQKLTIVDFKISLFVFAVFRIFSFLKKKKSLIKCSFVNGTIQSHEFKLVT